ncbi:MAG: hypothetical protein KAY32_11600 [Candidatus Eisenbacteria sp.]|nr:hypothetical protein [Candidatus Eisenbacteria bacterium]
MSGRPAGAARLQAGTTPRLVRIARYLVAPAILVALALPLLAVAGSDKTPPTASPAAVEPDGRVTLAPSPESQDGFYSILRASLDQYALGPPEAGQRIMIHKHRLMPKAERPPDRFIIVRTTPDVTLRLAAEPEWAQPDSAGAYFRLVLTPACADSLVQLAGEHEEQEIAIVVGGEVTAVRSCDALPTEGELQIPCSLKRPCRHIHERLRGDLQDSEP